MWPYLILIKNELLGLILDRFLMFTLPVYLLSTHISSYSLASEGHIGTNSNVFHHFSAWMPHENL